MLTRLGVYEGFGDRDWGAEVSGLSLCIIAPVRRTQVQL